MAESVANILFPEKRQNCGIDWVPTQNLGHEKRDSAEKLQANLQAAAKRDERGRDRELKRIAAEHERLREEI